MNLAGQELLDYVAQQRAQDRPLAEIAAVLGLSYKQLENRMYLARKASASWQRRRTKQATDLFDHTLGEAWTLTGDWMIVGDVHVPFTNYEYAILPSLVAQKHMSRPRRLLVGGDFYNFDLYSAYTQLVVGPSWKAEKKAARHMIDVWLETFDEIRIILGNHDRRFLRNNEAMDEDDISDLLGRANKVQWSKFGWCVIQSGNGDYRVTHPRNYSVNSLVVANELAQKHQQHVISFHEHHLAEGRDRFGRYRIINCGCLVDPAKLAYVQLEDGKMPNMENGFVMLKDGYPTLFGDDRWTDWSRWL
jgi:hypothetical protein